MKDTHIFIIIVVVCVLFLIKDKIVAHFDPAIHRADYYTVRAPDGWTKTVEKEEVVWVCPDKELFSNMPEAIFSIYATKPKIPLFLEDVFFDAVSEVKRANGRILDKGEIKIQNALSNWVLFVNEDPKLVILTFYLIDDYNRFIRIQYISHPKAFKKYRETFEKFKSTLQLRKMF